MMQTDSHFKVLSSLFDSSSAQLAHTTAAEALHCIVRFLRFSCENFTLKNDYQNSVNMSRIITK